MKKNAVILRARAAQRQSQHGRTLLELMISISIGLVVMGAVLVVYLGTTATSRQSSSISRINEDAAIAMALLGNSLRMAGYSPPIVLHSPSSALIGGVKEVQTERNFMGAAIRGCDHGFVAANVAFDLLDCNPSSNMAPAAFAVRYEGDQHNTIEVGGNPSDCLTAGITADTPSDYDSSLTYKLVESRFTVGTSLSNGTPELYCAGSGGTAPFVRQPLMQFVEGMVLTYGIAQDNVGGNAVRYATQDQIDATVVGDLNTRWSRVVSVKLCLVIRSDVRDQSGAGNYTDCAGNPVASTDGFVRRSFTSVFALRNRADFSSAF